MQSIASYESDISLILLSLWVKNDTFIDIFMFVIATGPTFRLLSMHEYKRTSEMGKINIWFVFNVIFPDSPDRDKCRMKLHDKSELF